MSEAEALRRRAEAVLGWKPGESNCFSLSTLREFIKLKSPKLWHMLGEVIRSGRHIGE